MRKIITVLVAFVLIDLNAMAQTAYVGNTSNNTISVINLVTNAVIATIPVGQTPYGVSVSHDGTKAYITNGLGNTVSIINTATNTVSATINVGGTPQGIVVNPSGTKVYVVNFNSHTISVINTATNTVSATINVGNYTQPVGISISPNGSKLYVTLSQFDEVKVINTTTNAVSATIPVGAEPMGICVSPDGSKVYVVNGAANTISVIKTSTNTVTNTIAVGTNPRGIAISPDGRKVYVANFNPAGTVSVIDTATNTVVSTIVVGNNPFGISVSPDGTKVCVADYSATGSISVINPVTNTVSTTIAVGSFPYSFGNFITASQIPLPIELLSFTANPVCNTYVNLNWVTTSEINNNYFAVMRSKDGDDYEEIGTVPGAGNSNSLLNYSYNDEQPYTGSSYYQLKQYDFDGAFSLSNMVPVYVRVFDSLSLYPNPTTSLLTLSLPNNNQKAIINLYNMYGEVLLPQLSTLNSQFSIDLTDLSQGIYFLEVLMDGEKVVRKIVKL